MPSVLRQSSLNMVNTKLYHLLSDNENCNRVQHTICKPVVKSVWRGRDWKKTRCLFPLLLTETSLHMFPHLSVILHQQGTGQSSNKIHLIIILFNDFPLSKGLPTQIQDDNEFCSSVGYTVYLPFVFQTRQMLLHNLISCRFQNWNIRGTYTYSAPTQDI